MGKRWATVLAAILIGLAGESASAQISVDQAQRKLRERQAQRPGTTQRAARAAAPSAPVVRPLLLSQAVNELRAGRLQEAINTATAFQNGLGRPAAKLTDPDWLNSLHVQAVAYMRLGQLDKAREAMDRFATSGVANRSALVNRSIIDITQKINAMRAAVNLRAYAVSHPDDEIVLNLWGVALDTAASRSRVQNLNEHARDYVKVCAVLEGTRPTMRRWGTKWITAAEHQEIERRRAEQQRVCDRRQDELRAAVLRLGEAKNAARGATGVGRKFGLRKEGGVDTEAIARVNREQLAVDRARAELERAQAALPRPSWTMQMDPVDPEFVPGGAQLAPVPAAAATRPVRNPAARATHDLPNMVAAGVARTNAALSKALPPNATTAQKELRLRTGPNRCRLPPTP